MRVSALFAGAIGLSAAAQTQAPPFPSPDIAPQIVYRERLTVEAMYANGVRVLPGVRYWTPIGHRPLTMDVYLPPETLPRPASGFPAIVYIHGGGWIGGDSRSSGPIMDFPGLLAEIAARGYLVASVNYRLSAEAGWPAQAEDIKAAIKFLRINAGRYGIDPSRLVAWGVSSGGHLAAIANVTCGVPELQPIQRIAANNPDSRLDEVASARVSDCVQGAVAWNGVFNMATIAEQARNAGALSRDDPAAPEWRLLRCFQSQCTARQLSSASPVSYVTGRTPPMLLIAGDRDRYVPPQQSIEMALTMRSASAQHQLIIIPGADHGLMGLSHQASREANQRALEATIRFIDGVVGLSPAQPLPPAAPVAQQPTAPSPQPGAQPATQPPVQPPVEPTTPQ